MKTIGFCSLHYGADYLGSAIRSVIDDVDEFVILYTPRGSYGWGTDQPIPERENRQHLQAIALAAAGNKLKWHDGRWSQEGQHRDAIYQYAPDADMIVTVDSDEVWADGLLKYAIAESIDKPEAGWRLPFIHYWRSFNWAILHDPAYPVRIMYPHRKRSTTAYIPRRNEGAVINHMGYAIMPDVCWYKIQIHGHRGEWRRDCDWYQDKFMARSIEDCHPVGSEYWYPREIDPRLYMPDWMQEHAFWGKDVIE